MMSNIVLSKIEKKQRMQNPHNGREAYNLAKWLKEFDFSTMEKPSNTHGVKKYKQLQNMW